MPMSATPTSSPSRSSDSAARLSGSAPKTPRSRPLSAGELHDLEASSTGSEVDRKGHIELILLFLLIAVSAWRGSAYGAPAMTQPCDVGGTAADEHPDRDVDDAHQQAELPPLAERQVCPRRLASGRLASRPWRRRFRCAAAASARSKGVQRCR